MAELNRCGVTTVLTADTYVELGVNGTAEGDCHVHQLTNTGLVELSEGIVLEDLSVVVCTPPVPTQPPHCMPVNRQVPRRLVKNVSQSMASAGAPVV